MMKPHFFMTPGSCHLNKHQETPEVLTDVVLLCVESDQNLHGEVNIKQISYI